MKLHQIGGILLLLLCTGCAPHAAQEQPADDTPRIKVGVSLYRQDDTFIAQLAQDLDDAAKQQEQAEDLRLQLEIVDAQYNQSLQNDQVDSFLQRDYDVVMVNVVDRTAAGSLIDKAKAADTPIIFFNREPVQEDLDRWKKVYYVGADAAESGRLEGSLVVDALAENPSIDRNGDGRLQYVMLEGDPGHQDSLIRTETSINTITEAGVVMEKLASGIANWQRVQASTKMLMWIEKYGSEIEVIIANNDDMALGAIDAYGTAGETELPVIVGIDGTQLGLQAVEDGTMYGTVYNDSAAQARNLIRLACSLVQDGTTGNLTLTNEKYLLSPYLRVTRDTVGWYTKE